MSHDAQGDLGRRDSAMGSTVAERLNYLIKRMTQLGDSEPSEYDLSEMIRNRGDSLSAAAIKNLRTGKSPDPKVSTLRVLGGLFGVDADYFLRPESADVHHQIEAARNHRDFQLIEKDPIVRKVLTRMTGMGGDDRQMVGDLVDRLSERLQEINERHAPARAQEAPATSAEREAPEQES